MAKQPKNTAEELSESKPVKATRAKKTKADETVWPESKEVKVKKPSTKKTPVSVNATTQVANAVKYCGTL
jgi:hypothetical protein